MLDPNIEQTQPAKSDTPADHLPENPPALSTEDTVRLSVPVPPLDATVLVNTPGKPKKLRRWPIVVGGIFLILALGALGGYLGYRTAIAERVQAETDQTTKVATEQFMLGLQAQIAGNHNVALRHFQYVIKLDPNFPGVKDRLAESMMALALARTPTLTPAMILPTATIAYTPTPDLRGEEEIFNNAKSLLTNKEWGKALEVLDTLRNRNIKYRPVEVDGMYYVALRHQGMISINQGRLETGLYQLALVERFAPLDVDADGLRTWARLYLTGASYWGVRWDKVVDIFGQIYPYYPNLHDMLGVTAAERYRLGAIQYGDQYAGQEKQCEAYEQYNNAQKVRNDNAVQAKLESAKKVCYPPTGTPTVTPTPTQTPTGTLTVLPTSAVKSPTPSKTPGATVAPTSETTVEPTVATTVAPTASEPSATPVPPTETPTPSPTPK